MKRFLQMLSIAIGLTLIAAPSHARTYDCSKAGNANKTVCKNAAKPAAAPAKPAAAERHYDCSKAGNANKSVCKAAATPAPAPAAAPTPVAPAARATRATPARPTAAPAAAGPAGATAMCNDGTYSHSAHRSGTCSHHGGVKTWY